MNVSSDLWSARFEPGASSHTVIDLQAERQLTGIMNFTNPGAISHNEILQLYRQYIDRNLTWQNFSVEEQAKVIIAPRSNNLLDTKRVSPRPSHTFLPWYSGVQSLSSACRLTLSEDNRHTSYELVIILLLICR